MEEENIEEVFDFNVILEDIFKDYSRTRSIPVKPLKKHPNINQKEFKIKSMNNQKFFYRKQSKLRIKD